MPISDYDGTTFSQIAKISDYDGTTFSQIDKVYDDDGTIYSLIFGEGDNMVSTSTILSGATSNAGTPSIIIYDSGDGRSTSLSSSGWRVQGNGRVCAALPLMVNFTGYTKLNFTVESNDVYMTGNGENYLALGYRTDEKTWINAVGVAPNTKTVLTTYGKTGDVSVSITSGHGAGYIIVEFKNHGSGLSNTLGVTISKIWLS